MNIFYVYNMCRVKRQYNIYHIGAVFKILIVSSDGLLKENTEVN